MTDTKEVFRVATSTKARELAEREAARALKAGLYKKLPNLSPKGQVALLELTKALLEWKETQ